MSRRNAFLCLIIFIALIGAGRLLRGALVTDEAPKPQSKETTICFEEVCLTVEVAQTPQEIKEGLMFRETLEQDKGMLFVFEKDGYYPFWMKNTKIALDIIWLDRNLEVVHLESVQPCLKDPCPSYPPGGESRYVLETNIGFSAKNNIGVGDQVTIKN